MKPFIYSILLGMGFLFSCNPSSIEETPTTLPSAIDSVQHAYLINTSGDSIPTGIPIEITGAQLDPDSVGDPISAPLQGKPNILPAHPNVIPLQKEPVVSFVPSELKIITPGKNGVPLPEKIPFEINRVPAIHTKPIPVGSLKMKERAKYDIQILETRQGMLSDFVSAIKEDKRGRIWMGTQEGLSCYDGANLVHFTETEGLSHHWITDIQEDSKGDLWLGTFDGGMMKYDGETFTHVIPTLNNGKLISALTLAEDDSGDIWFPSLDGVCRFDGENLWYYGVNNGIPPTPDDFGNGSIIKDSQGNIWIGGRKWLCKFDGESFTQYTTEQGLPIRTINSIEEDQQGNLWIGGYPGICKFDGTSFTHYTQEQGLGILEAGKLCIDDQGRIWMGAIKSGAYCFDGQSFVNFSEAEGLSDLGVFTISKDRTGNIWLGSWGEGAFRFDGKSFSFLTEENGLSHPSVQAITEDQYGQLWFGTGSFSQPGNGVTIYDGQQMHQITPENGLGYVNNSVRSILEDRDGFLWFLGAMAIRYDPQQQQFTAFTTDAGLSHPALWDIWENRDGELWLGTGSGGISRFVPTESSDSLPTQAVHPYRDGIFHYHENSGFSTNFIFSVQEDHKGNLWMGSWDAGAIYFDGTHFTHITKNEGLNDNEIWPIFEDSKQNIWIGTRAGGVNFFTPSEDLTPDHVIHFTKEDGLLDNVVISIIEDSQHNVWVATEKGINLFVPVNEAQTTIQSSKIPGYRFLSFDQKDGMKQGNFLPQSVCLDQNNQMWWGSMEGVSKLDLSQFELPSHPPRHLHLTHIEIDQQFVDFRHLHDHTYRDQFPFGEAAAKSVDSTESYFNYPKNLRLPYDHNHLTFHFSAIDWGAPHKIQYSYFIEGLDDGWSVPQSATKADYRNLPHGTHTLHIRAIGEGQRWSESIQYTFSISPPWWYTWWAYCLYGAGILGILWGLRTYELNRLRARSEVKRLQELDSVKSSLYTNITHEFRTPLTIILEEVKKLKKSVKESLLQPVELLDRNSKQVLRQVNQLLDLSKLESKLLSLNLQQSDIVGFLKYLVESFHSYAEAKNIQLSFSSEVPQLFMDYDADRITEIISNLLSNAIKFTDSDGEVHVQLSLSSSETNHLLLSVQDTGIGIPTDQLPRIFDRFFQVDSSSTRSREGTGIGLALVKELALLMRGEIEVRSIPEVGSTFLVRLPISTQAPIQNFPKYRDEWSLYPNYIPPLGTTPLIEKQKEDPDSPLLLIAEDHPDLIRYLVSALPSEYRIAIAQNGQEGIDIAIEKTPDLIITDVMMPKKDGFELCSHLKQHEQTSHIPIIMLTAKVDHESKIEGLERGADAYLPKPFEAEELLVRIRKLMELRTVLQEKYRSQVFNGSKSTMERETEQDWIDPFLEKVQQILEAHISDSSFGINELCLSLQISRSQLHRKITALTDISAALYLRKLRLHKGKELLELGNLRVKEVAYQVGFKHPAHFSKYFQEEFGMPPSELKKRL